METIKSLDEKSSRIEKIEEVIDTLGILFPQSKLKNETLAKEEPKFVHVPKVPRAKQNLPIAKELK